MKASGSMTTRVDRPADEVFAFIADAENDPQWRTAVIETRWLDPGPTKPGRRDERTSKVMGRRYTVIAEVVDWDPPHHVSWSTTAGAADVTTRCRVEPDGDGAIVTIESGGEFSGVWRMFTPLAAVMLRRQSNGDIERLKSNLDAATSAATDQS